MNEIGVHKTIANKAIILLAVFYAPCIEKKFIEPIAGAI
jgi:hypothetical protein